MRRRQTADAEQRHRDRDARLVDERAELVRGVAEHQPVAREHERPARRADELERLTDARFAGDRRRANEVRGGRRRVPVELAGGLLGVLGDVDEHGTRPAGLGDEERLAHDGRDFVGARDEVVVLRDGQRDARDVGLLERVGADEAAADLPGDADDRRRVHHRRRDAGDHVGRARTARGHGHADPAARARVPVGHVRRALLVANEHVPQRVLQHRVVRRKDRAARVPEQVGHPFTDETIPENLRTSQTRHMNSKTLLTSNLEARS